MTESQRKMLELRGLLDSYYGKRVSELIRERYSQDDELALLRQREEKAEDFAEYNAYAEECKARAKEEIYGGE